MDPKMRIQLPSLKNVFVFILIQFVAAVCILSYIRNYKTSITTICPSAVDKMAERAKSEKQLLIVLWTWPWALKCPLDKCEENSGISGCNLTTNQNLYHQADAVVFHHWDVSSSQNRLPQLTRPRNQHWVWFTLESPSNNANLWLMDNKINLTMMYRRDSDIFTPYGWTEILKNPRNFTIPPKTKLVSWLVSHWNPGFKHVQYFQELQKYIKVDVFGRNHIPLARDKTIYTISQYKFYLAFENSQHQDYITKKLWKNALISGAVPIVLGTTRANYKRFLPAEAFIHVDDFPSAKEMAEYLKLLDTDNEKYMRYFDWRQQNSVVGYTTWVTHYCKACRYLKFNPTYKTIPSVAKWFT